LAHPVSLPRRAFITRALDSGVEYPAQSQILKFVLEH
jgi:hypothetical protein